jgi:hypothetical protein
LLQPKKFLTQRGEHHVKVGQIRIFAIWNVLFFLKIEHKDDRIICISQKGFDEMYQ